MTPGFLRLSPLDNVAIAVRPEGAVACEHIPQGHKVALTPIAAGAPVVRYGAVTAYAAVDIDAPGAEIPIRTMRNLALNPNFGGETMVVSLGCEKLQPARLELPAAGDQPWVVRLRDAELRGFGDMLAAILKLAEARLERLNRHRRVTLDAARVVVGLQCGGSDAFSGVTANPAVGVAADLLVRAGATMLFSEVSEVRDAAHLSRVVGIGRRPGAVQPGAGDLGQDRCLGARLLLLIHRPPIGDELIHEVAHRGAGLFQKSRVEGRQIARVPSLHLAQPQVRIAGGHHVLQQ